MESPGPLPPPAAFNPRRAQSDPCENKFAQVRQHTTGGNPTQEGAHRTVANMSSAKLLRDQDRERGRLAAVSHCAGSGAVVANTTPVCGHAACSATGAMLQSSCPAKGNNQQWTAGE